MPFSPNHTNNSIIYPICTYQKTEKQIDIGQSAFQTTRIIQH